MSAPMILEDLATTEFARAGKNWTDKDEAKLVEKYKDLTAEQFVDEFEKNLRAIASKAHKLHLNQRDPQNSTGTEWDDSDRQFILDHWNSAPVWKLSEHLGRSLGATMNKIQLVAEDVHEKKLSGYLERHFAGTEKPPELQPKEGGLDPNTWSPSDQILGDLVEDTETLTQRVIGLEGDHDSIELNQFWFWIFLSFLVLLQIINLVLELV